MADETEMIGEAARLWVIRIHDPSFTDWDGYTAWLERDPRHLSAYEGALESDGWAANLLATTPSMVAVVPSFARLPVRRRWFAMGGAVAAMLVAVVGGTVLLREGPERDVMTASGEHRTVVLSDGSRVELNGNTRIRFDPDMPRRITLAQGEALFDVKHDTRDPFVVLIDGTRLVDIGTVFNVVRNGGSIDVAVAEGAVDYEMGRDRIRLNRGDALSRASNDTMPSLRKVDPETIGSWQTGLMHYDDAPLDEVARDLSRNIGSPIRVRDGVARMRFTGTLRMDGSPQDVLARAGPLLGVSFAQQSESWAMSPVDVGRR